MPRHDADLVSRRTLLLLFADFNSVTRTQRRGTCDPLPPLACKCLLFSGPSFGVLRFFYFPLSSVFGVSLSQKRFLLALVHPGIRLLPFSGPFFAPRTRVAVVFEAHVHRKMQQVSYMQKASKSMCPHVSSFKTFRFLSTVKMTRSE